MAHQPLVSLRLPAPLLERVQDRARREDRTVSNVIRRALKEHVGTEQHEKAPA